MIIEKTIHFDNAREAQDLTGNGSGILSKIGSTLAVQLTARDTWLKLEGEEDSVSRASEFFSCLRNARNNGALVRHHGIAIALQAYSEGREADLEQLFACRVDVSTGKSPVFARTFGQMEYLQSIREHDLTFGIGPAGTGKTYLAMSLAVSTLLQDEVNRIVLCRPAVEAGEALGFLPGDVQQKVGPYLRPLYDALHDMMDPATIDKYMERGVIEVAPLAYMRGRTLNSAFIILDEAQNTTPEQMLMFLTRMGFGSKCVITGDLTQIDLPTNKTSGLIEAHRTLQGVQGIAFTELKAQDVVRHELVQRVIEAYNAVRPSSDIRSER